MPKPPATLQPTKQPICETVLELAYHAPEVLGYTDLPRGDKLLDTTLSERNGLQCEGSLVPYLGCLGCPFLKIQDHDVVTDLRMKSPGVRWS